MEQHIFLNKHIDGRSKKVNKTFFQKNVPIINIGDCFYLSAMFKKIHFCSLQQKFFVEN